MTGKGQEKQGIGTTQGIDSPLLPRLLPLKKAAEFIGISEWALRERVWAGDIPFFRYSKGRKIFIKVSDIDAFIEAGMTRIT